MVRVPGFRRSGPLLPTTLEKKVWGGRNRLTVGGDVWAACKAAEHRQLRWWLSVVGPGLGRGCHH
jgi:hypothetical protein